MEPVVRSCPLCGSSGGAVLETIDFARIWAALEREWSPRFTADVIARHTPAQETDLRECEECGLQYFVPCLAGDRDFYEQLMGGARYSEDRWEFRRAAVKL